MRLLESFDILARISRSRKRRIEACRLALSVFLLSSINRDRFTRIFDRRRGCGGVNIGESMGLKPLANGVIFSDVEDHVAATARLPLLPGRTAEGRPIIPSWFFSLVTDLGALHRFAEMTASHTRYFKA